MNLPLIGFLLVGFSWGQEPLDDEIEYDVGGDPLHRSVLLQAGTSVEYVAEFEGALHVWVQSEAFDPSLRVELAGVAEPLVDTDSGSGTTAYLRLEVSDGQAVTMRVSSAGEAQGTAELHWVSAPETDAVRTAAAAEREELEAIKQLQAAGNLDEARQRLVALLERLEILDGDASSERLASLSWDTGYTAYALSIPDSMLLAWSRAHDFRERVLPKDHLDLLSAKSNVATARLALGDLQGALELSEYVHEAKERVLPAEHPSLLRAKRNLGVLRAETGDLDSALELIEYVHDIWVRQRSADDSELLQIKSSFSDVLGRLGDFEEATELLEYLHAAYVRMDSPENPEAIRVELRLALLRLTFGHAAEARELLESVHATWERLLPPDHHELLDVKMFLAHACDADGDLERAFELYEHVLGIQELQLPSEHPRILATKDSLASTYFKYGDLERGLELQKYVHAVRERSLPSNHPDLLGTKINLAAMLFHDGDLEGSLELHEYVYAAQEHLLPSDHPDRLSNCSGLATTREALGDLEGAAELRESVHEAKQRLYHADNQKLLVTKNNLAITRLRLGNLEGARQLMESVHAAQERLFAADHPDHTDLLMAKANLSLIRTRLGDLEGGLELALEAHAAWKRTLGSDHPRLIKSVVFLAETHKAVGNLDEALELLEAGHAAMKQSLPTDHADLLQAKVSLAEVRKQLGDHEGALATTLELLESQVGLAQRLGSESPRVARATIKRELSRFSQAIGSSRPVEFEKAPPMRARALFTALAGLRAASTDAIDMTLACAADATLETMRGDVASARRRAADAALSLPDDAQGIEAWRTELVQLAEQRDRLQRALRRELVERGLQLEPPSASRVAAALAAEEAYVSFLRYHDLDTQADAVLAFVVTPDDRVQLVELGACDELETLATQWRKRIGKPVDSGSSSRAPGLELDRGDAESDGEGSAEAVGRALRERLLDPCLALLGKQGLTALHVVPDDFMLTLPLDALPYTDGRLMGEVIPLHVEVSARRIVTPRAQPSGNGSILAFGGIDYDAGEVAALGERLVFASAPINATRGGSSTSLQFVPLAQTRVEAERIGQLFERLFAQVPLVLSSDAASKQAFVDHASRARFLHIATHGWFAPPTLKSILDDTAGGATNGISSSLAHAERSITGFLPEALCGLAFAGANHGANEQGRVPGILTAEELSAIDLHNCELAVLSACETNVGIRRAGQGIQSLQTSLHAAGVRTAITSLWKVDDDATRHLMELFYTNLWERKLGKAKALWKAKMALRDEGAPLQHWAGWVLTGNPH